MSQSHAAAYIRVSTHEQEELSPDSQLRLIKDYCKTHGYQLNSSHIFIDGGISGRGALKRAAFLQMIACAKSASHPFDVILVWKFSRFARNQEESILYKSMLKKTNVEVISVSEPIEDSPFGSLIERIIEWMDEYYSIRLSDEVHRGMTQNALKGGINHRLPFGYIKDEGGNVTPSPKESDIVRKIFDSYIQGSSLSSISAMANTYHIPTRNGGLFSPSSIRYILSNPLYMGTVCWNRRISSESSKKKPVSSWIITPNCLTPIIDEQTFLLAGNMLQTVNSRGKNSHWLEGLIYCSICLSPMYLQRTGNSLGFQCPLYHHKKHMGSQYISARKAVSLICQSSNLFDSINPDDDTKLREQFTTHYKGVIYDKDSCSIRLF